jgi:hypothetical protein
LPRCRRRRAGSRRPQARDRRYVAVARRQGTDYVLYGGGLGQTLLQDQAPASTTLESVGDPGPGKWVTIYANAGHAYVEVAGIYLDIAGGLGNPPNPPPTSPRWSAVGTGTVGFIARHPPGL